jgi:hypothetical protein
MFSGYLQEIRMDMTVCQADSRVSRQKQRCPAFRKRSVKALCSGVAGWLAPAAALDELPGGENQMNNSA